MSQTVDPRHFQELNGLVPAEVCRRALCSWDEAMCSYSLSVWGDAYSIYPGKETIEPSGAAKHPPHDYLALFMIHYLLGAQEIPAAGEWISEKDLPGGSTFFRGPHTIPTHVVSNHFGNDLQAFRIRCQELCGASLDLADSAFRFRVAPRIPVAVLYFEGDEDFPAESKILYDKTIGAHLALDIVFALAWAVSTRIAGKW